MRNEKHNPIRKPVTIKLQGVDYIMVFDFEAVATAEDITGRPLLTGLSQRDVTSPSISLVRAMLFASLLPVQPDTSFAEAKAMVTRETLVPVWVKVLEAWNNSMPEPEPAKDDAENPTQDQS